MPSRILLISANGYDVPYAVFPLGLAQVNAALRAAGHETRWVDCLADTVPVEKTLAEFQPDFVGVSLRNIDDVAFKKRETFYGTLFALCDRIRQRSKARIIVGGSGFSIFPERLLERSGADFGIQGEGEAGLLALLVALESGSDPREIPGLVFRNGSSIRSNPQRPDRLDRPVITEDTGFGRFLPVGEGLFAFTTQDDIFDAIKAIEADPGRHRAAAQRIAREYFDAEKQLGYILKETGLA